MSRHALRLGLFMAALLSPAACRSAEPLPIRLPHAERAIRVGFWFGMSNNQILTPEVCEWIGQRASIVILNGTEKGIDPCFDYVNVVARLKRSSPELPVLLYDWLQWDYRTGPGGRVGGLSYAFLEARPEWQLKDPKGRPVRSRAMPLDVRHPDLCSYLIRHVADNVQRFGVDGVAFDVTHATLPRPGRADRYQDADALCAQWPQATVALMRRIKTALGPDKIVLYNGLFGNQRPGRLAEQASLLDVADAAAVEFFGRNVHVPQGKANEEAPFDQFVLDYVKLLRTRPDKIVPVFARSPRYVYLDYEEDYRIQRYCLASYLLAMTPLSTYKYHSHFQTGYAPPGRTYGMSYYADYDLDVGRPLGDAFEAGGIHMRRFSKALVAVAPMGGEGGQIALEPRLYSPEGKAYQGPTRVDAGTGLILMHHRPTAPPESIVVDDFEDGRPGMWRQPVRDQGVSVRQEGGGRYLCVRPSPDALYAYHERRVQPIRSLTPYHRLRFRIRSTDPSSAVLVRVEVSDSSPPAAIRMADMRSRHRAPFREEKRTPYVVLVLRPQGGSFAFKPKGPNIAYGQRGAGRAPYIECTEASFRSDGQWHTVDFRLRDTLARGAPHLTPHRVPEMRLIGSADLDDIVLARGAAKPALAALAQPKQTAHERAAAPAAASPVVAFRETFERGEPTGWFRKGSVTRVRATDEAGWRVALGPNLGVQCGLAEIEGSRMLLHQASAGRGDHKTTITCPLAKPVQHAAARTVTMRAVFKPLNTHAGGPYPWNKQFRWDLLSKATGYGYGMALDVQANKDSPENRLLRINVYTPETAPNCDDLRISRMGFWAGPRMGKDLEGVSFDVRIVFSPTPAPARTDVRWTLTNRRTGESVTGSSVCHGALPRATVLDTISLTPARWVDGAYDELVVEAGAH